MTSPSAPAHPLTFTDRRLRPSLARRSDRARSHVVLGPLAPVSRPHTSPVGYVTRPPEAFAGTEEELAWIRWTVDALAVLAPGAFLAAPVTAETLLESDPATLGRFGGHLMPILESARLGRRLALLDAARERARALGLRCAVGGHRVASARGFDAVVVDRSRAAATLDMGECRLLVATGLRTPADLDWARQAGASLIQGEAVAEPLRVAPVDVRRLQR